MQTMQDEMVIMTPIELQKILKYLSLQTLCVYLDNYQFSKFRLDTVVKNKCNFIICDEFLSLLYTTLLRRCRSLEAKRLKNYFNTYTIKYLDYED